MRYFIILVTTLAFTSAGASELTWGFKSPAFHYGNGYSNHVLAVEQLQFNRKKELQEEAEAEENKELGMQIINEALKFCWVPLLIWPCWNLALVPLFGLPTIGFFKSIAIYLIIKIVKL